MLFCHFASPFKNDYEKDMISAETGTSANCLYVDMQIDLFKIYFKQGNEVAQQQDLVLFLYTGEKSAKEQFVHLY